MHDTATRAGFRVDRALRGILFVLVVLLLLPLPSNAATLVVDDVNCGLVDAFLAADTDAPSGGCPAGNGADTIVLTVDVTLTEPYSTTFGGVGLPLPSSDITLLGGNHTIARADDAPLFRFLADGANGIRHLQNVTLSNFAVDGHDGGAIFTPGILYLTRVTVSGNQATNGGGIDNHGILHMDSCTVSGNTATDNGGGVYSLGNLVMTNSTVSGNSAGDYGGGIYFDIGPTELTNSTIATNSAGSFGGGISGPHARTDQTVPTRAFPLPIFENMIIASNGGAGNCDRSYVNNDVGSNYDDDRTCGPGCGLLKGLDPILADNGGPTLTHALPPGSTAIDAAGDCGLARDQRGALRNDGACDSGSYEFQCSIELYLAGGDTWIGFAPDESAFDLVTGDLAVLLGDAGFDDAVCMGSHPASPALDLFPNPAAGSGRYYLARGLTSCMGAGYGASGLTPDPRDDLDSGPCP